jgi:hypothetical protein
MKLSWSAGMLQNESSHTTGFAWKFKKKLIESARVRSTSTVPSTPLEEEMAFLLSNLLIGNAVMMSSCCYCS